MRRISLALMLVLAACKSEKKLPPPKPLLEIAPAGMASAAKLVTPVNAIDIMTRLAYPRELVVASD